MTRIPPENWVRHKDTILDLYLVQNKKLHEVMTTMKADHGFEASKKQYTNAFKRWGIGKNGNKKGYQKIFQQVDQRQAAGKETVVYQSGRKKSLRTLKRAFRRLRETEDVNVQDTATQSPAQLLVQTPASTTKPCLDSTCLPSAQFQETFNIKVASFNDRAYQFAMPSFLMPGLVCTTTGDCEYCGSQIDSDDEKYYENFFKECKNFEVEGPFDSLTDDEDDDCDNIDSNLPVLQSTPRINDIHTGPALSSLSIKAVRRRFLGLISITVGMIIHPAYESQYLLQYMQHGTLGKAAPSNMDQLLEPAGSYSILLQLLQYSIYLSANNSLEVGSFCQLYKLILRCEADWVIKSLLKMHSPMIRAFETMVLVSAVRLGLTDMVNMLLKQGVDVNSVVGMEKKTAALPEAVRRQDLVLVERLLEYGATLDPISDTNSDQCPSLLVKSVTEYANVDIAQAILRAGATFPQSGSKDRKYITKYATSTASKQVVGFLIDNNVSVNELSNSSGTILQAAARNGDIELINRLISSGVDVDYPNLPPSYVFKLKLNGGETENPDAAITALQCAVAEDHVEICQILLHAGASPNGFPVSNYEGLSEIGTDRNGNLPPSFGRYFFQNLLSLDDEIRGFADPKRTHGKPRPYLWTPLSLAAHNGNSIIMRLLLDSGADVNASGLRGTALQAAAGPGPVEFSTVSLLRLSIRNTQRFSLVRLLIDRGANINSPASDRYGRTALQAAVEWGAEKIVEYLLDAGADIHAPPAKEHGLTALQAAISSQDLSIVKRLIEAGASVNEPAGPSFGRTCLQLAACQGNLEMVEFLLEHNTDVDGPAALAGGFTALQGAILGSHHEVVRKLLDADADVNGASSDHGGYSAVEAAVEKGNEELLEELLARGADPNQNVSTPCAVSTALHKRRKDIVSMLLQAGARPNGFRSCDYDKSPLHYAIDTQKVEYLQLLFEAGLVISHSSMLMSLQEAADASDVDMIQRLIQYERESGLQQDLLWKYIDTSDFFERVGYRYKSQFKDMVRLLLDSGANPNGHNFLLRAIFFDSDEAQRRKYWSRSNEDNESIGLTALLLRYGSDANLAHRGMKPLCYAAQRSSLHLVKLLLGAGADIDGTVTKKCYTPLQAACEIGHFKIARFLLQQGAQVNAAAPDIETDDMTALQLAVCSCNHKLVLLLLEKGADITTTRKDSMNALDIAASLGYIDIARILLLTLQVVSPVWPEYCNRASRIARNHGQQTLANCLQDWLMEEQ